MSCIEIHERLRAGTQARLGQRVQRVAEGAHVEHDLLSGTEQAARGRGAKAQTKACAVL